MDIRIVKPSVSRLSACIDCIYLLRQGPGESARYISFPSVFTNLSLLRHCDLSHTKEAIRISARPGHGPVHILRKNLLRPCLVEYNGMVEEVTIFFRPMGILHFPILGARITATDTFISYTPDITEASAWQGVWSAQDLPGRLSAIESALLRIWQPFSHAFLGKAVDALEADPTQTTESLAAKLGISRKTLHQHFEQYLGISPTLYRKIARFRKAVRERMDGRQVGTLTDLAYTMDFFDQSHMIRDFKSLTGFNPREYFRKIRTMENGAVQWIMQ